MSGGSAREIWEEIELVGDILGQSGRDRRERFFDWIQEAVLDKLLWDFEYEGKLSNMQFLSEEDTYRRFVCPQSWQSEF